MRQSLIIVIFALIPLIAGAEPIKDRPTAAQLASLKNELRRATSPSEKLAAIAKFNASLSERLRTIPLPETAAEKAAFADLNELQTAFDELPQRNLDRESCHESRESLLRLKVPSADSEGTPPISPALQEALVVSQMICR